MPHDVSIAGEFCRSVGGHRAARAGVDNFYNDITDMQFLANPCLLGERFIRTLNLEQVIGTKAALIKC